MKVINVRRYLQAVEQKSGWLMLAGVTGALLISAWRWKKDREFARQLAEKSLPVPYLAETPPVSVLVAAWNESDHIRPHIESILALDYPRLEYILCAGGQDGTYQLAAQYQERPGFILLQQQDGEGKQNALRRCLERASGEIIYLTDADCRISELDFEALLAPIIQQGELATTGQFAPLPGQQQHPFVQNQWCVDHYARARMPRYIAGLIGRNAAIERSLLALTGDFQDRVQIGTDYYLARQILAAGYKIRHVPESRVATHYHTKAGPYLRQQSRWLRNIFIHSQTFGAPAQVRSAGLQIASSALLLVALIAMPFSGFIRATGLALLVYGWGARLRYLDFGARTLQMHVQPRSVLLAPIYFLLDRLMLVYTLVTLLTARRRWRW